MAAAGKVIIITKKAKGHGHHGGAWKVAYADFVTAMMALFIMLWILSQTDKETKQVLSQYFRTGVFSGAPSTMQGGSGLLDKGYLDSDGSAKQMELESLDVTAAKLDKVLRTQAAGDSALSQLMKDVSVKMTDDGLLITIVDTKGDMIFDLSSAALKPALIELLSVLGPILSRLENKIQVHGHTDGRKFPPGSPKNNWNLSFDRADRARAVLEPLVNPGQIMGVYAHGDAMLVDTDPLSPMNRRLEILAVNREPEKRRKPAAPVGPVASGVAPVPAAVGSTAPAVAPPKPAPSAGNAP